jgi:LL-diaminopimelate aminotransferase
MPKRSSRLDNLPQYIFSIIGDRITALKAKGADVIRIDIGSPDLPPPDAVIEALSQSAQNPANHGYTGYRGLPAFREAIAEYYQNRFGVSLDPNKEVLPLLGSKEGLVNLSLAYLSAGDVALVPDIGYPSYSMGARIAGGEIYWLELNEENGYKPDISVINADILERTKLLWVNYPNNPTGAMVDLDFYTEMAEFCNKHDILLVSDNPYMDITFDGNNACSALQTPLGTKNIIELYSFSKSYNMAGWRLGAAVGDEAALKNLLHVKSNVDSGHFRGIYDAGIAALNTPQSWIDNRNQVYKGRRDRILATLSKIGLSAKPTPGSIYVWARVDADSKVESCTYTDQALNEAHVSIAPGEAYGPGGKGFVRISLGITDERLDEALNRLETWYSQK